MANSNSTGVNSDFYSTLKNNSDIYGGNVAGITLSVDNIQDYYMYGILTGGSIPGITFISNANNFYSTLFYVQRIYDLTLNKYVYYKLTEINTNPGSLQTTPNHSGNISLASHEVLATSEVISNI